MGPPLSEYTLTTTLLFDIHLTRSRSAAREDLVIVEALG